MDPLFFPVPHKPQFSMPTWRGYKVRSCGNHMSQSKMSISFTKPFIMIKKVLCATFTFLGNFTY